MPRAQRGDQRLLRGALRAQTLADLILSFGRQIALYAKLTWRRPERRRHSLGRCGRSPLPLPSTATRRRPNALALRLVWKPA